MLRFIIYYCARIMLGFIIYYCVRIRHRYLRYILGALLGAPLVMTIPVTQMLTLYRAQTTCLYLANRNAEAGSR